MNNIWEIAEAYLEGTLLPEDVTAVNVRLRDDAAFAAEFNENINLLNSLNSSGKNKKFRALLSDMHQQQVMQRKSRLIQLPAHFWRTAAVAAGVALLASTGTYTFFANSYYRNVSQYNTISREVEHLKNVQRKQQEQQNAQNAIIDSFKKKNTPTSEVRYTGTGFAITNDGYFVTAYHVINYGKYDSVYILCNDDKYYKAVLVNYNPSTDLALMKVEKKNFKFGKGDLPYALETTKATLSTPIFTIGYPKDYLVYSEGYVSAGRGYAGNEDQYTLAMPAGHGQSGSPVINANGNVTAVLTGISGPEEANTYAANADALIDLLEPVKSNVHMPKKSKLAHNKREQQISLLEDFTFSVKVYKK